MLDGIGEMAKALLAGCIVGVVFSAVKLPLPAPRAMAGILGILGIFLGFKGWTWLVDTYFKSN